MPPYKDCTNQRAVVMSNHYLRVVELWLEVEIEAFVEES